MPSAASVRLRAARRAARRGRGVARRRRRASPSSNTGSSKRLQKSGPGHSPVTSRRHAILSASSSIVVGRLIGRHGDVDGDRRERADLALMARHAPLLLPQHAALRCSRFLPLPRVRVSTHSSSRPKSVVTGTSASTRIVPLSRPPSATGMRCSVNVATLKRLSCSHARIAHAARPTPIEREQQARRPRPCCRSAISPGTMNSRRQRDQIPEHGEADRDVRGACAPSPRCGRSPIRGASATARRGNCSRSVSSAASFLAAYARAEQQAEADAAEHEREDAFQREHARSAARDSARRRPGSSGST